MQTSTFAGMATERVTFSIPAALKKKLRMKKYRGVNWSGIVAQALEDRLARLEIADRIAAGSQLTQADVDDIADKIDDAMARHFGLK